MLYEGFNKYLIFMNVVCNVESLHDSVLNFPFAAWDNFPLFSLYPYTGLIYSVSRITHMYKSHHYMTSPWFISPVHFPIGHLPVGKSNLSICNVYFLLYNIKYLKDMKMTLYLSPHICWISIKEQCGGVYFWLYNISYWMPNQ